MNRHYEWQQIVIGPGMEYERDSIASLGCGRAKLKSDSKARRDKQLNIGLFWTRPQQKPASLAVFSSPKLERQSLFRQAFVRFHLCCTMQISFYAVM